MRGEDPREVRDLRARTGTSVTIGGEYRSKRGTPGGIATEGACRCSGRMSGLSVQRFCRWNVVVSISREQEVVSAGIGVGAGMSEPAVRTPPAGRPHEELLYETIDDGRIAIITLNRPDRLISAIRGWRSVGWKRGRPLRMTITAGSPS